ncbi:MAG: N-acetyl-alpha-D-glucosaminyl L-malate synthase BshA [Saprospiraceae bacterium]|nr:N-acetyl-alpha-D-glucosaminyl L-malate synthase BshA [Saprospiraceae bacterium]MBK8297430.1 N-acetyl-alpha-D-glucosaminyl L-malate synthase BshA [Saprospiraceae bacterium]
MNIGIVCYPTYGGSGVVATELGMALARKGHKVHFISYRRPARLGHFLPNVFYHEVAPFEYPLFDFKPMDTALASKIVDVALYENLDVLHVHYAIPHATIGYLAREILRSKNKALPFVTTLHGTDITLVGADRSFFPVVEFSINQSNAVTAVSQALKNQTHDTFDIQKNIIVIPNFIDFDRFTKKPNPELRLKFAFENEKILMHVSNFRKVKRVEDVLAVFKMVNQQLPSKLVLIGDGPERPRMEMLSREWGISHEVCFLGKQDNVEELLAISDLFLLPSEHESFGLAALEAMACEVPIIASNIGGLTEVILQGKTGYACPVADVAEMSDKAIYILSDPDRHAAFRLAAFNRAKDFDIHQILPMYEDTYYECRVEG